MVMHIWTAQIELSEQQQQKKEERILGVKYGSEVWIGCGS